jgi:hypothetical protein
MRKFVPLMLTDPGGVFLIAVGTVACAWVDS